MSKERIDVTRTYLPPLDEYLPYLKEIWSSGWVTNQGSMVQKLETGLQDYLNSPGLNVVANGTLALQLAIRALELQDSEVITTPFSYVATINSLLWERAKPLLVDINPKTLNIDLLNIEDRITTNTKAILAVHTYGYPAPLKEIEEIARRNNLKVIYDAAHAFGTKVGDKHLSYFGDITCYSFHATKSFHCIEGGAIVSKDLELVEKINWMRRFGHLNDDYFGLGINAKMSELHAAMGLINITKLDKLTKERKKVWKSYDTQVGHLNPFQGINLNVKYNYSYFPVILKNEGDCILKTKRLNDEGIYPRRYFYPSLAELPHYKRDMPITADISRRVLCLPLYGGLDMDYQRKIINVILK